MPHNTPIPGSRHPAASAAFFQEAVSFAARAHRNQLRKDGKTPYVAHVLRVAMTTMVVFRCEDPIAIQSAILHDTIEDTTTDYEDIESRFGPQVASCVSCLTKNMALPEAIREKEYMQRLAAAPWQARLVKLADCYDNLCDLPDLPETQRARKARDAMDRSQHALDISEVDALAGRQEVIAARQALLNLMNTIG